MIKCEKEVKIILAMLELAVKNEETAREAYNSWHDHYKERRDMMTSDEIRREHNAEAGHRANICLFQTEIINLARKLFSE